MNLFRKLEDKVVHNAHRKQFEDAIRNEDVKRMIALLRVDGTLNVNTVVETKPKGRLTPLRVTIDHGNLEDSTMLLRRGANKYLEFDRLYFEDPTWDLLKTNGIEYARLKGRNDILSLMN
jgi:hypothetical protein